MADGGQPRRACSCGAPKRVFLHVALVATLVLLFLFFQDSLPSTPWLGKEGAGTLKFSYVRSWWQVQHGDELKSVGLATTKARESLRSLSPERTAPLGNHMSVDEWTQGTESQQLVSAKAQSKTRVGKQTKGTKSQQIEAAEVPKHLYNDDQTEGTESQGIRLADFHKKMASLSKSNIAQAEVLKPLRTLRFEVCNSYTNQRLALVFGILLANVTSRTPVLPHFLFNVDQFSGDDVTTAEDTVLMEEVYDTDGFLEGVLRRTGVRILLPTEAPKSSEYAPFSIAGDWRHWLDRLVQVEAPHVALDCTFLKLGKDAIREREGLVWAVLDSLNLNVRFASMRDAAARLTEQTRAGTRVRRVRQRGPAAAGFNFLHLRIENDWLPHCERWEALRDGVPRVNCLSNTWNVHEALRIKGMDPAVPLYVAADWDTVDPEKGSRVLWLLKEAGYQVLRKGDVFDGVDLEGLSREQGSALNYYLALESDKFIGNSVSTFTALLLAERAHASKWASYYNGQNVPLSSVLPLYKLPWVFTFNSWSEKYDYMVKVAVRSAVEVGGVRPYCMFSGKETSAIYKFLVKSGVKIIKHNPLWADDLAQLASKGDENRMKSHLYADSRMMVGTFMRIDIPILEELTQYDYVLFTDADVFFRQRIDLDSFPASLPPVLSMAYENDDTFPYNAGVMLMNLPALRTSYDAFLKFILSNDRGLHFGEYGPGDQGAYNQYYEADLRSWKLPQVFNAKPYHEHNPDAVIVHFHGAKPHDYAQYLATGECPFAQIPEMCESAVKNGYCAYVEDWAGHYRPGDGLDPRFPPTCSRAADPA